MLSSKIINYVRLQVADGSHVDAGQAYCEMEVMKMITTLLVNEVKHFININK
jgi:biotin carboxyl carrier protein